MANQRGQCCRCATILHYYCVKTSQFLVAIMYSSYRRSAAYEPMGLLHVLILGVNVTVSRSYNVFELPSVRCVRAYGRFTCIRFLDVNVPVSRSYNVNELASVRCVRAYGSFVCINLGVSVPVSRSYNVFELASVRCVRAYGRITCIISTVSLLRKSQWEICM